MHALSVTRPMVKGLFIASCLLSIVSWYTTQQGMALYLSAWFSVLASIGIQTALVLVAWLIGFTKTRRALLIGVYAITAAVSIAFSYVSLYTWFEAKERPAAVQRKLYDALAETAGKTDAMLSAAISEGQKHVLALEEMTAAEKSHGFISRAQDSDPYLARVREAVAREAQTYSSAYREGTGEGLRYTAFDRYTKLARQNVDRLREAQQAMAGLRGRLKPLEATEQQLREFRQVYDGVPWSAIEETLHQGKLDRAAVPSYQQYIDRTVSGQEDLMVAFQELFGNPSSRHVFAFALAAFIDIVVFLLAFASGPYFFGSSEHRWTAAGAALDSLDTQVFTRDFLRKLTPSARGMARVEAAALSPGEQQLCLLLVSKRLAIADEEEGKLVYLIDEEVHERMLETLAAPGFHMRASARVGTVQAG